MFMLSGRTSFMCVFFLMIYCAFSSCSENNGASDPRDLFTGSYAMTQSCDNIPNPDYMTTIVKSEQDEQQIIIQNLGAYGAAVSAIVQENTLEIPSQEVGAGLMGKVTLSGNGTINASGDTLHITLEVLVPAPGGTKSKSTCQIIGEKEE